MSCTPFLPPFNISMQCDFTLKNLIWTDFLQFKNHVLCKIFLSLLEFVFRTWIYIYCAKKLLAELPNDLILIVIFKCEVAVWNEPLRGSLRRNNVSNRWIKSKVRMLLWVVPLHSWWWNEKYTIKVILVTGQNIMCPW